MYLFDIFVGKIFFIGFVLYFVNDGDIVWGIGWNGKILLEKYVFLFFDVCLVCGFCIKDYFEKKGIIVFEIFGDLGILVFFIYLKV